ncbi:polyprotein, partial [Clonorchis sinensis]
LNLGSQPCLVYRRAFSADFRFLYNIRNCIFAPLVDLPTLLLTKRFHLSVSQTMEQVRIPHKYYILSCLYPDLKGACQLGMIRFYDVNVADNDTEGETLCDNITNERLYSFVGNCYGGRSPGAVAVLVTASVIWITFAAKRPGMDGATYSFRRKFVIDFHAGRFVLCLWLPDLWKEVLVPRVSRSKRNIYTVFSAQKWRLGFVFDSCFVSCGICSAPKASAPWQSLSSRKTIIITSNISRCVVSPAESLCCIHESGCSFCTSEFSYNPKHFEGVFKPRKHVYLGAFNVRSLKQAGQQVALARTLDSLCIDLSCLSETRTQDTSTVIELTAPSPSSISRLRISDDAEAAAAGFAGVGIVLNERAEASLLDSIPVDSRLCAVRMVPLYSVLKAHIVVVAGDINAQVCAGHRLFLCNTSFRNSGNRLHTWHSPTKQSRIQIDHITVSFLWRGSFTVCSYFWKTSVDSNQTRVRCCLSLCFSGLCKTLTPRLAIGKLLNPEIRQTPRAGPSSTYQTVRCRILSATWNRYQPCYSAQELLFAVQPRKKSFSCSTLSMPNWHATRRLHEG